MENSKEKIAAVLITYNRKELLKECLDALLSQSYPLDSIILVDNASTDGTPEFLKENGYLDNLKIDYVRLSKNTGSSGGYYAGIKRAYERGFDWVWPMDDDCKPLKETLKTLLETAKRENLKYISSVMISDLEEKKLCFFDKKYKKVNDLIFHPNYRKDLIFDKGEGFFSLIHKEVIKNIGFPERRYFIYGEDTDYLLRIKKRFPVATSLKAFCLHPSCRVKRINFLGKNFYVFWREKPLLNFFYLRNFFILFKKYRGYISPTMTIKQIIKYLIFFSFKERKIDNFKILFFAFFYGIQEKFRIPKFLK